MDSRKHFIFLIAFLAQTQCQTRVGDSCIENYTKTYGKCRPAEDCNIARNDYQQNGIRPTFCTYSAFGTVLVCCRDQASILNSAGSKTEHQPPVWGSDLNRQSDTRRVSERKCEEYSREVVEKVEFLPLVPNPETISLTSAKCDYIGVQLIVGGEKASQGEFPHMVAIGFTNFDGGHDFKCGGSLISNKFVLTAGHCIRDPGARDPAPVVVRLGDQNIDPSVEDGANPVEVPIRQIHKHPEYKPPVKYNDIALLELVSEVSFESAIRPACLWTRPDFSDNTMAIATGWGVIDPDTRETSKELQKVSLSLFNNNYCDQLLLSSRNRLWKDGFRDTQMCAGELRGGKDTCQGDSGSPLQVVSKENQCIFNIVGITSFGVKCAKTGQPAIYTRVYSYLNWIESVVWPGE